jgi:hypothetical protein
VKKRLLSLLVALSVVLGGIAVSSTTATADANRGGGSQERSSETHDPKKKCARWKKKAADGNKRAQRKYNKHCKAAGGGDDTGGDDDGDGDEPATCPAYVPGEEGAEAPTTVVTDTATAEAPIEVAVEMPGAAGAVSPDDTSVFHNIQVDTTAESAGLWVRFEMTEGEDLDIYLHYNDGSHAAGAAGLNPAPEDTPAADGQDDAHGGHTEMTAEQLDGIGTPDCGGYTLEMQSFSNPPGEHALLLWLGDTGCEPPCGEPYP